MRIGMGVVNRAAVFLPEHGIPFGLREAVEFAIRAEALGYAYITVAHSLLAKPRWTPIPMLAAIAARTNRARLATTILQPNLYNNPVLLAQEIATLDVISQGRLTVGLGLGSGRGELVEQELALCRVERATRGKRFAENVEVLQRLLTEDEVTFHGRFYKLDRVRLGLKPTQQPRPPFWIAASVVVDLEWDRKNFASRGAAQVALSSVPAAERVAKYGDGWMADATSPESFAQNLRAIRALAAERYGRRPDAIEGVWGAGLTVAGDVQTAFDEVRWFLEQYHGQPVPDNVIRQWHIFGKGPDCIAQLQRYAEADLDTFIVYLRNKAQIEQMERIAREVLPAFR